MSNISPGQYKIFKHDVDRWLDCDSNYVNIYSGKLIPVEKQLSRGMSLFENAEGYNFVREPDFDRVCTHNVWFKKLGELSVRTSVGLWENQGSIGVEAEAISYYGLREDPVDSEFEDGVVFIVGDKKLEPYAEYIKTLDQHTRPTTLEQQIDK